MQASKCQTQHGGHRKGRLDIDKRLPREKSTVSTTKHPSLQTKLIAKVSLQVRHLSPTFTKRSRPLTVLLTLHPMSSASPIISSQARGQYTVTWATYDIYWWYGLQATRVILWCPRWRQRSPGKSLLQGDCFLCSARLIQMKVLIARWSLSRELRHSFIAG